MRSVLGLVGSGTETSLYYSCDFRGCTLFGWWPVAPVHKPFINCRPASHNVDHMYSFAVPNLDHSGYFLPFLIPIPNITLFVSDTFVYSIAV